MSSIWQPNKHTHPPPSFMNRVELTAHGTTLPSSKASAALSKVLSFVLEKIFRCVHNTSCKNIPIHHTMSVSSYVTPWEWPNRFSWNLTIMGSPYKDQLNMCFCVWKWWCGESPSKRVPMWGILSHLHSHAEESSMISSPNKTGTTHPAHI